LSGLADALIKIEENTLRLQTVQTRGTVNPEPLSDVVPFVTVIVVIVGRFGGNEAASPASVKRPRDVSRYIDAKAKKKTPSDRPTHWTR